MPLNMPGQILLVDIDPDTWQMDIDLLEEF
jgi:dTDP-4-amino-4,6-dideoxygalactose transaminase